MQPLLSKRLGTRLVGLRLIHDNGRCCIYRAFDRGTAVVIKQYRGQDPTPARREAEALRLYSRICEDVPDALPVRPIAFNANANTLCMEHVEGRPLSEVIDEARSDRARQGSAGRVVALTGVLLRRLHETTRRTDVPPSQFLREYMEHTSRGLRSVPLLGSSAFRDFGWDVGALWAELLRAREPTSTVHGDPALDNIIVRGERVALIDFEHTNGASHLLSDRYALSVSLRTRRLSQAFRTRLADALHDGTRGLRFAEPAHRFYWELQRRRWLFLKLIEGNAFDHAQALRRLPGLDAAQPRREGS